MNRTLALLAFAISCWACHSGSRLDRLKTGIENRLHQEEGQFAVAFKELSTGDTVFLNEHERFHAASTMKTPVMIELYRQARQGRFSLSDSIVLRNAFHSIVDSSLFSLSPGDDSDTTLYQHLGEKRTVNQLIYLMITRSSNLATDLLVELVGAKNVTQTLRSMGAQDIQVLRGVEDDKAFQKGLNNEVTAYDLMLVYEQLALGKIVDSAACASMIDVLDHQEFNDVIPAQLPKEVKVAHKTGSITAIHHDSGIIFLPDGRRYVLVLLSKGFRQEDKAIRAMADVSGMIYQYVTGR